jgi:hypothetical protein
MIDKTTDNSLYALSKDIVAPALISYVEWVISEAQKRNISTLYFLARDGYTLVEIAKRICEHRSLTIECRYLYCSRIALRVPTFHLIGNEAYEYLLVRSFHNTVDAFFKRANLTEEQRKAVLQETGIPSEIVDKELTEQEFIDITARLKKSKRFKEFFSQNSLNAYNATISYLRQEGLFDQQLTAIVDSGWSGSCQRSLRQLLESAGYRGQLVGFYFGLIAEPKEPADGEYLACYFSKRSHLITRILFSFNLFECLLSAPHGMTTGYQQQGETIVPIMSHPPGPQEIRLIEIQNKSIIAGTTDYLAHGKFGRRYKRTAILQLRKLMSFPTYHQSKTYSAFYFCDDMAGHYVLPLVDEGQLAFIKECSLLFRVKKQLARSKIQTHFKPLWEQGTISLISQPIKRIWYRVNALGWTALKRILSK